MKHLNTPVLETERLLLRPFRPGDAPAIYKNWASNPRVTRYLTWRFHQSLQESERLLQEWLSEYHRKGYYQWAIVPKSVGEPVGSIGCTELDRWRQIFELGYCMSERFWGHGVMTEAARAVTDFMFGSVKCRKIVARFAQENIGSRRVMEKLGMLPSRQEPEALHTINGLFTCPVYEIERTDWLLLQHHLLF